LNRRLKNDDEENEYLENWQYGCRDDLFYRLNIVSFTIPPLRERRQDIAPLSDCLLAKINLDLHKKVIGVSDEMMEVFMNYYWPGKHLRSESGVCRMRFLNSRAPSISALLNSPIPVWDRN
jgi:DNA-binding NtrC family response regulator